MEKNGTMTLTSANSQFNHDLINAYQQCEVLYDCENVNYKTPLLTRDCWTFVANHCGTTPHECKVRWKALRDRYIKERKRRILHTYDYTKKGWALYNKMDFLDKFVEKQRLRFSRNSTIKEKKEFNNIMKTGSSSSDESLPINTNIFSNEIYDANFDDQSTEMLSANVQLLKAIEGAEKNIDMVSNNNSNEIFDNTLVEENLEIPSASSNTKNTTTNLNENITFSLANASKNFKISKLSVNELSNRKRSASDFIKNDSLSSNNKEVIEALKVTSDALNRVTQTIFPKDPEGSFGEFISSTLRTMSFVKKSTVMQQIFEIITSNSYDDI